MDQPIQIRSYKKKMEYSYSFGAFPTVELLKHRPEQVVKVLVHSELVRNEQTAIVFDLCWEHGILVEENDRAINRINNKENCFVVGVFQKFTTGIDPARNHIVLVNPGDMGNMGTIIRTSIGFGIRNLAIIEPGVDVYHPKVVRASMGSIFQMNLQYYQSFTKYEEACGQRQLYTFMLDGATDLRQLHRDRNETFSLIFGNESSGLGPEFGDIGTSVFINHTDAIDSLNLSMAVGIGLYEFVGGERTQNQKERK